MERNARLLATIVCAVVGCGGSQTDERPASSALPDTPIAAEQPAATAAAGAPADSTPASTTAVPATVTPRQPDPAARTADSATAPAPTQQPQITTAQDPAALLKRTAGVYSAMRSMQASFEMVTRNPLLNSTVRSRGTLYQRRPDRIRLQFADPKDDMVLGDGQYFWVYYPSVDAKQVTRTSAANAAGVVDLQAQFIGDPLTRFEHKVEGRESVGGRDALVMMLVPREDPGYRSLKIWIDTDDALVRRFEVTDNSGIVRRLDLSDLQVNPTLSDALFRFTPPEGVRIVERG